MDLETTAPSMAVLTAFMARLASVVAWVAVAVLHAVLLALLALALWAAQVSPQAAWDAVARTANSTGTTVLSLAIGGSLLGAWTWAAQKLARSLHKRIGSFVLARGP